MFLTKNRLKKNKFKDDDDLLYYLKYSHLEPIKEDDIFGIETSNKATQAPDIMNNFSQTDDKVRVDKETDTYDELKKIDRDYYLTLASNNFKSKEPSRADKMAQVWARMVKQRSPPSSHNESDDDDGEGFLSRNFDRGLRMAQLTGNAMLMALNMADGAIQHLASSTVPNHESEEEEVEVEIAEVPTSSADVPQHEIRERSRSRDNSSDDNMGHRLLRRGASRSRSSTPKGRYPSKKK